jgi:two-component system chemotaxis response regulator CheB
LPATHAKDAEHFYPGHVYVAPPDRHLLLAPNQKVRLTRGPRENHFRPAADPLFRSAARHYGPRVVGVVLTGAMYDGTAGLMAIRAAGGLAVVQDPADALVDGMPLSATQHAGADHVVPVAEMSRLLVSLVQESSTPRGAKSMDPIENMTAVVEQNMAEQSRNERNGELATYTCPECGGNLWQVNETGVTRFRCHVGHVYQAESLLTEQSEALEAALWTAVRTFREKSVLTRQLAEVSRAEGNHAAAARYAEQAGQADEYSALIRKYVLNDTPTAAPEARRTAPAAEGS